MSVEQGIKTEKLKKIIIEPLTQEEVNELQRLNLINARTEYDAKNVRYQLDLRRESQGWVREYIR